jgi:hypothetical protein
MARTENKSFFKKKFWANAFIYLNAYQVKTHNSIAMLYLKALYPGGIRTRVCCL